VLDAIEKRDAETARSAMAAIISDVMVLIADAEKSGATS
jgi:DNA-binding GntR family transcriptional regulator